MISLIYQLGWGGGSGRAGQAWPKPAEHHIPWSQTVLPRTGLKPGLDKWSILGFLDLLRSQALATKLPAVNMASLGFQEIPSGGTLGGKGWEEGAAKRRRGPVLMILLELLDPATSYCFIFVCFNFILKYFKYPRRYERYYNEHPCTHQAV